MYKRQQQDLPFYYASSAATYGLGDQGYSDEHDVVDSLRPLNPYGYSKKYFDQWILSLKKQPKTWMGFKFFNVFGPNEYHKEGQRSVVHQAFEQIQEFGEVKLFKSYNQKFSDGGQLRDFVYVLDCVRAMMNLREKKASSGLYNLGTGIARSFSDLAKAVFESLGKPVKINYIEMPEQLRDQYQYYTQAEVKKIKYELPNFTFNDLETSVNDYVKNYLLKPDPYL